MATKEEGIENALSYLATGRHPDFAQSNLMASYQGEDGRDWIDIADKTFVDLVSLPRTQRLVYDGVEPLTTVSERIYGNTSLWILILACSDHIHPHQIGRGEIILLPSVVDITSLMARAEKTKGLQGQTVII